MAFFRVALGALTLMCGAVGSSGAAAAQEVDHPVHVALIIAPEDDALRMFVARPFAIGLGVFPESRDPARFLRELGAGAPGEGPDTGPPLPRILDSERVLVLPGTVDGPDRIWEAVAAAFAPGFDPSRSTDRRLEIHLIEEPADVHRLLLAPYDTHVVIGIRDRTPVVVGLCDEGCPADATTGVLTGAITRRPGIVTPYDLTATILDRLGVVPAPNSFAGNVLETEPAADPTARISALEARLVRDASYAPGLAAVTVALGVGSIIVALGLWRLRGRTGAALRVAQAAVFVLPGWIAATFVPSARWEVRSIVVLAAVALGASIRPRDPVRTLSRVGLGAAAVFATLVVVAPLNPGGEPGLTIWGNPLVSWRFFGLANVPAAIIASGIVVWGVMAGLAPAALAALAVVGAVVIGAPSVGANFVGVLTFVFGASAAVIALARRRASLPVVVIAAAAGIGAFVLALVADVGSPVSHGGRAAQEITDGGWSALWDVIWGRLRLNAELIRDFGGGVLWVAGLVSTLGALIAWGLHPERGPVRGRVAVLGGGLMAIASLVLEDSGFYSGAVLWFVTVDAWLLVTLVPMLTRPEPSPSDAGG